MLNNTSRLRSKQYSMSCVILLVMSFMDAVCAVWVCMYVICMYICNHMTSTGLYISTCNILFHFLAKQSTTVL